MPDKQKVIKGLECCTRYEVGKQLNNCLDCPYVEPIGFNQFRCKSQEMKEDALAMLKEQEAVEPIITPWVENEDGEVIVAKKECGRCGYQFFTERPNFCENCGTPILWERYVK